MLLASTSLYQVKLSPRHILVFPELGPIKVLARPWRVCPEAPLPADGTCAFDADSDDVTRVSGRRQVDVVVFAGYVGSTLVGQRK